MKKVLVRKSFKYRFFYQRWESNHRDQFYLNKIQMMSPRGSEDAYLVNLEF